jgi:methylphosphotriester-DNA--protein-cysteine methyltransferase
MAISSPSQQADKGSTVMRFSTADYAPRDRLAAWHVIFGKTLIKLDIGFGDLSYFNRAFRRRYGASPSDVRARALSAH